MATRALDLSERFFEEIASPSLEEAFPQMSTRMAVGLVGEGIECFGLDDEVSQQDDWGVEFYIWMTGEDFASAGDDVIRWKRGLMSGNPDVRFRNSPSESARRTVIPTTTFYDSLIGFPNGPKMMLDWRSIPEERLALATNGRVFSDPLGSFTSTRNLLLDHYPESLRRKKIAARCFAMAQTGQYDYLRAAQRGDVVGGEMALSGFASATIAVVFLLNRRYMPCLELACRAMADLPLLAGDVAPLLVALYDGSDVGLGIDLGGVTAKPVGPDVERRVAIVEKVCSLVIDELHEQELSESDSDYMLDQAEDVQAKVGNRDLVHLPVWAE